MNTTSGILLPKQLYREMVTDPRFVIYGLGNPAGRLMGPRNFPNWGSRPTMDPALDTR